MDKRSNREKNKSEFYDLSERLLNSGDAYWGNLGYWKEGCDYSEACEALARQLACAVNLRKNSRVLDAGFGCGDQLLLWLKNYHIQFLCGINYSVSQTELAKQRLEQLRHDSAIGCSSEYIIQGDVADLNNFPAVNNNGINTVLALDCAYHFPSRKKFFEDSFQLLRNSQQDRIVEPSSACIGLTDIVLAGSQLSWGKRALLNIMLSLSRIPRDNIVTLTEYEDQLQHAGFDHVTSKDISGYVFESFGSWLASQEARIRHGKANRSAWLKYKVTAAFLAWAYRNEVLRYIVISAKMS